MAATAQVQIDVDADVAAQATALLESQGTSVAEVVNCLLGDVVRHGGWGREPGQDAAYDAWLRTKVQEALEDPRPYLSNDEAKRRWAQRRSALVQRAAVQETCV